MTTLAHLGGVPEALSVLVPLALVVVMLRIGAKRRPPEGDDGTAGDPSDPPRPVDPQRPVEPPRPGEPPR